MQKAAPRLLIAGTNSGCGKTTVTCAILQALVDTVCPSPRRSAVPITSTPCSTARSPARRAVI